MLAAEIVIPQMFTTYAENLGYPNDNGMHHFQYFCEECNQAFVSAWGRKTGCMGWYERGDFFHCPNCGMKHSKHVAYVKRDEPAPNQVRLTVKTFQNAVVFEATSKTVEFRDLLRVHEGKRKEIFRFDIAKQSVSFTYFNNGCEIESMEIGDPFKLGVLEKSMLGFFYSNSLANSRQKTELSKILRVLRESVHSKLEKRLGYKVASMYVSPGCYGVFLLPIFNLAYRVMFPDTPNLPVIYRENPETIRRFWEMKMISSCSFMDEVIKLTKLTKSKQDFITSLATVNSIPDKPTVRKILSEDPFDVSLLAEAFALCQNYDYALQLYSGLKKLTGQLLFKDLLLKFLQAMLPLYGEAGVVHLVEAAKDLELQDCIKLYQQLNEENQLALQTEQVKLKDLHDWMARRHRIQQHVNLKFNIPEHIVRRLSMQKDRMKFFLPKESLELLEAGTELHNCVASYGSDMKDNSKWIVLVADDKGKLAACLEVRGKKLMQAKIDKNQPVANDVKLNAEVVAWAKEAKLEIKTADLKVKMEEKVSVAV